MNIPLGEVVYFDVVTSNPSTGAVSDADSTPTFEVFEEATDTDIGVGGNLTKRTSKTGDYRGTFTASGANGFEVGKWYNVVCSATVNSTAGKCRAMLFRATLAENVAGVPPADVVDVLGVAATTSDGTASAGGAATITLQSGQSYGTNLLRGRAITITGGTGAGQSEIIASNTNASPSVVTVARNWGTQPSTDSTYTIGDAAGVDWSNVNAPTTTLNLSGTTVGTVTALTNAPSDSSGVTTLLGRLTSGRAGNLDNLDAAISTRSTLTAPQVYDATSVVFVNFDGDRTTSGTTLAAAITGASSGTVVVAGPGTYLFSSQLTVPVGVSVRGFDRETTILASTVGSGNAFTLADQTGTYVPTAIERVTLYATSASHVFGWGSTTLVNNAALRNCRLLSANGGNLINVSSSAAGALTIENVIGRCDAAGTGIKSTSAGHAYRVTDCYFLLFGSAAAAGIDLASSANVRGFRVEISLPDAASGTGIKVANTSSVELFDSGLYAQSASINVVDNTAAVRMVRGQFDRAKVTGFTGQIVDIESPASGGITTASFASGATVPRVTLVDTTTTVTNTVGANVLTWLGTTPLVLVSQKVQAAASIANYLATGTVASTTGTTTTLDTGSVNTASYYANSRLVLTAGTGAGQERVITGYASGRIATHAAWTTNPNNATAYEIRDASSTATATVSGQTVADAMLLTPSGTAAGSGSVIDYAAKILRVAQAGEDS